MEIEKIDLSVIFGKENMYYLTGFNTPGAPRGQALVITKDDICMVSRILEVTNAEVCPILRGKTDGYAEGEDPIGHLSKNILKHRVNKIGIEKDSHYITPKDYNTLENTLNSQIVDISHVIRGLRSPKSEYELSLMRKAGEIVCESFKAGIEEISKFGPTENKVAGAITNAGYRSGGEYAAYPAFVAFGKNGSLGHYAAKRDSIKEGELAFFEIGGCYERYHAAAMRTIYIGDVLPNYLVDAQNVVQNALDLMRQKLFPGVMPKEVYDVAKKCFSTLEKDGWVFAKRAGYSIGIGYPIDWGEADEICIREIETAEDKPIPLNATIHLIPWIRHHVYGGIGLSDTVVVTENGAKSLLPPEMHKHGICVVKLNNSQNQ